MPKRRRRRPRRAEPIPPIQVPRRNCQSPSIMHYVIAGVVEGFLDWVCRYFGVDPLHPLRPHPEALEKIETGIDERQLGRSEVIGEIARPKKN